MQCFGSKQLHHFKSLHKKTLRHRLIDGRPSTAVYFQSYFQYFFFTNCWRAGVGISSLPEVVQFTEYLLFFYITADVSAQRCLAHAARQASHVPAHVVHLRCKNNIFRFRTKHLCR